MAQKFGIMIVFGLLSAHSAGVQVEVELDMKEVAKYMPASGQLVVRFGEDIVLPYSASETFSFDNNSVKVLVVRPDRSRLHIDSAVVNRGANIFRLPGHKESIENETVIRVPFFLLKTEDEWIFDIEGTYSIDFRVRDLPGIDTIHTQIEVVERRCESRGRYMAALRGRSCLSPFEFGVEMSCPFPKEDAYGHAYHLAIAYSNGGLPMIGVVIRCDMGRLSEVEQYASRRIGDRISECLESAYRVGRNVEIWEYARDKHRALRNGEKEFTRVIRNSSRDRIVIPK